MSKKVLWPLLGLILAALALIGLTTFKSAAIADSAAENSANCAVHNISKTACYLCDPTLRDPKRLWCKEHNRYEDRCFECHPEIQDKNRLWCKEHSLYEDECFFCHPELLKDTSPALQEHSTSLKPTPQSAGDVSADTTSAKLCDAHKVPVTVCYLCDPKLRESKRLWCKEHDRYEDRCFVCHPEIQDKNRLWCKEHSLYEDECFFCHPELIKPAEKPAKSPKDKPADKAGDTPKTKASLSDPTNRLQCKEHRVYEDECGICHPDLLGGLKIGDGLKVRLASASSAARVGVKTVRPANGGAASELSVICRARYNQNRFSHIAPLVEGVVQRVLVDVGDNVQTGQVLLEINSPHIAELSAEYLSALAEAHVAERAFQREKTLLEREITAAQSHETAQAAYEVANSAVQRTQQQLRSLGLSQAEVEAMARDGAGSSLLRIRAPFAGMIVARDVVMGQYVETGADLLDLTDMSTLWLELAIPENMAGSITIGSEVTARFESLPDGAVTGKLAWIAPAIDEATGTIQARALIKNPARRLKHGQFGQAVIAGSATTALVRIPAEAVQHIDQNAFVFTRLEADLYEARRVQTGGKENGQAIILAGLSPQDEVVVTPSFTLKSELLKSKLGAGCVDE